MHAWFMTQTTDVAEIGRLNTNGDEACWVVIAQITRAVEG
jgi:hypothetical protein